MERLSCYSLYVLNDPLKSLLYKLAALKNHSPCHQCVTASLSYLTLQDFTHVHEALEQSCMKAEGSWGHMALSALHLLHFYLEDSKKTPVVKANTCNWTYQVPSSCAFLLGKNKKRKEIKAFISFQKSNPHHIYSRKESVRGVTRRGKSHHFPAIVKLCLAKTSVAFTEKMAVNTTQQHLLCESDP